MAPVTAQQVTPAEQDRERDAASALAPASPDTAASPGFIWQRELPAGPAADGAADEDRLFLPLESGELISLARDTGVLLWRHPVATRWPPLRTAGALLVASERALHEIDPATGTVRRSLPLPASPAGPLAPLDGGVVLSLASGAMAVFEESGQLRWTATPGDVSHVPAAASEEGDALYVALGGGRLAALRATDGHVIWTREIGGTLTAPAVRDARVYVGSTTQAVHAFDGRSGRLLWSFPTGGAVVGVLAGDEALYVAALDNVLRALHPSRGSLVWKRVQPTRPLSPPERAGARLVMGGVRPQLLVFDASSGAPVAPFTSLDDLALAVPAGAPIVFPGTTASGVGVALVTRDGRIVGVALDAPAAEEGENEEC